MIKVLWINPVSDSGQNAGIARELAAIRQPGTEIHVCLLDLGDLCAPCHSALEIAARLCAA